MNRKRTIILVIALVVIVALAVILTVFLSGRQTAKANPLGTYWSEDSAVAQSLRDYVSKVTNPKDTDR